MLKNGRHRRQVAAGSPASRAIRQIRRIRRIRGAQRNRFIAPMQGDLEQHECHESDDSNSPRRRNVVRRFQQRASGSVASAAGARGRSNRRLSAEAHRTRRTASRTVGAMCPERIAMSAKSLAMSPERVATSAKNSRRPRRVSRRRRKTRGVPGDTRDVAEKLAASPESLATSPKNSRRPRRVSRRRRKTRGVRGESRDVAEELLTYAMRPPLSSKHIG
jgi:hypothetical protein